VKRKGASNETKIRSAKEKQQQQATQQPREKEIREGKAN